MTQPVDAGVAPGPLAGIRVLEFTQIVAGPVCGVNLSDLGADVIKVEPPGGDSHRRLNSIVPGESKFFQGLNRGKRSLVVDLHVPGGRELIHRLVPGIDVVINNYRLGVPERLGIDYATLRAIRPDLIYWQNTGFGERGPEAGRPGSDIVAQAYSGLMAVEGKLDADGAPASLGNPYSDFTAGFAASMGICAALYHRERTGRGQYVSTSLLQAALFIQSRQVMREPVSDAVLRDPAVEAMQATRAAGGSLEDIIAARLPSRRLAVSFTIYYGGYHTQDGAIVLGALTKPNRDAMRRVLGIEDEPSDDPDFDAADPANIERAAEWKQLVRDRMRTRTSAAWVAAFDAAGVPVSPLHFPEEMSDDPQVIADGLMTELVHTVTGPQRVVGPAVRLSESPTRAARAAPALGEHTREVLAEFGLAASEIDRLTTSGVIRTMSGERGV